MEIVITLAVLLLAIVAMTWLKASPDLTLMGALTLLIVSNIITTKQAFSGFTSDGLMTVALLFVVAEGLRQTGGVNYFIQQLLGRPKSLWSAQLRLMLPAAAASAFVNNTPVVAMMLPVVNDWAKKIGISASKLMMPLSFAAIMGGLCTIIGTSTSLILNDELQKATGTSLGMFDISWIGLPCALAGIAFLVVITPILLADRKPAAQQFLNPREYTMELLVDPNSPLVGKTIEAAGLRSLPGCYLIEIDRSGEVLGAVSPQQQLHADDRLIFVGIVESMVDLQKLPGLVPATNQVFKLDSPRSTRCLLEAVVSNTCPIVNLTIREARFRSRYNAAVLGVARNGYRLTGKIGDIALLPGDTLLLEADNSFAESQRNSRDFFLVSKIEDSTPVRHEKAWISQLIFLGMIIAATALGPNSMIKAAMVAAGLMILTRCVRASEARRSLDLSVILTIGAGLGLKEALVESGTANLLTSLLLEGVGQNFYIILGFLFLVTTVLTNLITAKAAGLLVLPIALETAVRLSDTMGVSVSPLPFVIAVMMAAGGSYATPIGFQTNLMVYGPGGYHFFDFLKVGGPVTVVYGLICVALIPLIWPFVL